MIIDVNNTKLDETKKREQTRDSSNAMGAFEMRNENEAVSTLVENKVVTTLAKPCPIWRRGRSDQDPASHDG